MLSISSDAKTVKGLELGFLTGILYLSPADKSGHNVCPMAKKAQCKDPCLDEAGRGAFDNVQLARLAKTDWYFNSRDTFMAELVDSVFALVRKAIREDLTPLARNEWICWTIMTKKPETRANHIDRTITELLEGVRRPCCWAGCIHRTRNA
jgi:hypothetical protein